MNLEKLKYPIGKFELPTGFTKENLQLWIESIVDFPAKLHDEVSGLRQEELNWKYRPGGWSIRQVVHHCADSHMNAFVRFKLTLTENSPEIKPYIEYLWAELPDATVSPITSSFEILSGLHNRWGVVLDNLSTADLMKTYIHAEYKQRFELRQVVALYAWHCNHHLQHVIQAKTYGSTYT